MRGSAPPRSDWHIHQWPELLGRSSSGHSLQGILQKVDSSKEISIPPNNKINLRLMGFRPDPGPAWIIRADIIKSLYVISFGGRIGIPSFSLSKRRFPLRFPKANFQTSTIFRLRRFFLCDPSRKCTFSRKSASGCFSRVFLLGKFQHFKNIPPPTGFPL